MASSSSEPILRDGDSWDETDGKDIIYFAKPEELKYIIEKFPVMNEEKANDFTIYTIKYNGRLIRTTCGEKQGWEFSYRFMKFMFEFRPRFIIMCGICASPLPEIKVEEVIVGTYSRPMSGKLRELDFSTIELDMISESGIYQEGLVRAKCLSNVKTGGFIQFPFVVSTQFEHLFNRLRIADRHLIAADMESWSFMNITKKFKGQPFPVVKGVSDKGALKTDDHHEAALLASFMKGVQILQTYSESERQPSVKRVLTQLSSHPESTPGSPIKKEKKQFQYLTMNQLEDMEIIEEDLIFLKKLLKKESYDKLGIQKFKQIKKSLSKDSIIKIEPKLVKH